jgi:MFS family permease
LRRHQKIHFVFLNLGHFIDHLLMLVFATAAALTLAREWGMSYAELIPYATPGFVAFGLFSLPAGWLADKWSREGMMLVFFFGIGISAVATALAQSPLQIAVGLFAIGVFGAIYHPVGIPLVIQGYVKTGLRIAVNGVFGNLGVASAALLTGYLVDQSGWRSAFIWPGLVTIVIGVGYAFLVARGRSKELSADKGGESPATATTGNLQLGRDLLIRIFAIVFFSTAVGSLVFQSTTFSLPKIFDERLGDLAISATLVGWYAFVVFAIASMGQLVVGYLLDRFSIKVIFVGVAIFQVVFFLAMIGRVGSIALLIAIAFMLVVFGQIPINDVLVGRVTKTEWRSRAYGLRYVIGFTVMASAVPMVAWIYARWSFDALFIVLAAAGAGILIAVMMLPRQLASKA